MTAMTTPTNYTDRPFYGAESTNPEGDGDHHELWADDRDRKEAGADTPTGRQFNAEQMERDPNRDAD